MCGHRVTGSPSQWVLCVTSVTGSPSQWVLCVTRVTGSPSQWVLCVTIVWLVPRAVIAPVDSWCLVESTTSTSPVASDQFR